MDQDKLLECIKKSVNDMKSIVDVVDIGKAHCDADLLSQVDYDILRITNNHLLYTSVKMLHDMLNE